MSILARTCLMVLLAGLGALAGPGRGTEIRAF
jgi:hypothetical protein